MVKKLTVWYYNVIKLSTDKLKRAEVSGTVPKAQRNQNALFPSTLETFSSIYTMEGLQEKSGFEIFIIQHSEFNKQFLSMTPLLHFCAEAFDIKRATQCTTNSSITLL